MAANYWESTQHAFWELGERADDYQAIDDQGLAEQHPLPDRRLVNNFIIKRTPKNAPFERPF